MSSDKKLFQVACVAPSALALGSGYALSALALVVALVFCEADKTQELAQHCSCQFRAIFASSDVISFSYSLKILKILKLIKTKEFSHTNGLRGNKTSKKGNKTSKKGNKTSKKGNKTSKKGNYPQGQIEQKTINILIKLVKRGIKLNVLT